MLIDFQNKTTRFFVLAFALYFTWYLLHELVVKPYTPIDEKLISLIISNVVVLLKAFGFKTYQSYEDKDMQLVGIDGAHPVWIGTPCNALTLFMFFTLFIIAFPGSIKKKIWFVPLGIIIIHLANVLRVASLAFISFYAPTYLEFNHTYTFTIIVYGIIFLLWMWWVKLSLKQKNIEPKN